VSRFTEARRAALLAFVESGWSLSAAAARVGVSRQVVHEWLTRGRQQPDGEHGAFAAAYDALRAAQLPEDDDDLPEDHPWRWVLEGDPLVALEPSSMDRLTGDQRCHAAAVSEARTESARAKAVARAARFAHDERPRAR
jgi:hypothetical protein